MRLAAFGFRWVLAHGELSIHRGLLRSQPTVVPVTQHSLVPPVNFRVRTTLVTSATRLTDLTMVVSMTLDNLAITILQPSTKTGPLNAHVPPSGDSFGTVKEMRFRDVLDGLSNTIAAGEVCTSGGKHEVKADFVRNITSIERQLKTTTPACIPARCKSGVHIDPARPQFYDLSATVSASLSQSKNESLGRFTGILLRVPHPSSTQ